MSTANTFKLADRPATQKQIDESFRSYPWLASLEFFGPDEKPLTLSRADWRKDYDQRNAEKPK
jgi:hypothetical protein